MNTTTPIPNSADMVFSTSQSQEDKDKDKDKSTTNSTIRHRFHTIIPIHTKEKKSSSSLLNTKDQGFSPQKRYS
jgi:hypothetical protein